MPWYKTGWFTVLCGIATVASLLFGFWTYFSSIRERTPTFYVARTRSTLVNAESKDANGLTILYEGQPIKAVSVTSIQIYFWNDGKEPIRRDDILKPIRIAMPGGSRILKASIVSASRDVCNFRLLNEGTSDQAINLAFDIAEHGDGARIQVLFAGPVDARPEFSGVVLGARSPTIQEGEDQYAREDRERDDAIANRIALSFGAAYVLFVLIKRVISFRKASVGEDVRERLDWTIALKDIPLLVGFGYFAYHVIHTTPSVPKILLGP